jgi:hypothetical protein
MGMWRLSLRSLQNIEIAGGDIKKNGTVILQLWREVRIELRFKESVHLQ